MARLFNGAAPASGESATQAQREADGPEHQAAGQDAEQPVEQHHNEAGQQAAHRPHAEGQFLQVVYTKPRVTWDAKALDGYAVDHPELFAFRKEGNAGASVRAMK